VNIICSNINFQVRGNENDVATATTTTPYSNYGAPFPQNMISDYTGCNVQ
jgi:hypothetical protein